MPSTPSTIHAINAINDLLSEALKHTAGLSILGKKTSSPAEAPLCHHRFFHKLSA